MSRALSLGLLLAVMAALALRCPQLDVRPMHNDEAVNAIKLRDLWQHAGYRYDPMEYHGPTLPYFSLVWMKAIGAGDFVHFTETQLRFVTVLFGTGLILLLPLVADGLGRRATICAGMLTAISPAMVFYSRYYIHEMLLVFFTLLALGAGWRYTRNPQIGWALLAGAAVGLMQATKETFVLSLAAAAGAWILTALWDRRMAQPPTAFKCNYNHLAAAAGIWFAVVVLLFTSFFTNAAGLLDSIRTYLPMLHRAGGASPHVHGWDFYLVRLLWFHSGKGPVFSEGLILGLAVIGAVTAFARKSVADGNTAFVRFLSFFTLLLTIIYCVIGYKTPWCLLNFLLGMILLAGFGATAMFDMLPNRANKIGWAILLLVGAADLAFQAWQAAVPYASNRRNPYVYAQTSPSILDLVERVQSLAEVSPQKNHLLIKVLSPDGAYWPLPWYLRQFDQVGWWSEVPPDPSAPVMIVSTKLPTHFDDNKSRVMVGIFELRPQTFFELYVDADLWRAHVAANSKK
jgi:uncharacterized protein (TIGR03663 family)